ncbi:MAG: hypothetical protein LBT39_07050 [Treponema sp.]|jgi:hypothetical protein|nr:hypothetical protein [Treponema sp.]
MLKKTTIVLALLVAAGSLLTAQELKIDYQYKTSGPDIGNFLTFTGPLRYIETKADKFDANSGASLQKSTRFFSAYQNDVLGKTAFPAGLRGLLLYPVAPDNFRADDNLQVSRAPSGVITIQYIHRGVAYGIITDNTGKINLGPSGPSGVTQMYQRTVGYIQGTSPQVLHTDFSSDGTAAKSDFGKVWSTAIVAGKAIGNTQNKTGPRIVDSPDLASLFYWSGALQVTFDNSILKISGTLKANKR